MSKIELKIETFNYSLNGLLGALENFGCLNDDFNGNNGDEYLWECSKGYESNQAYTLDLLRNRYKDNWQDYYYLTQMCDDYFSHLFDYRDEYTFNVDINDDDCEGVITLAYKYGEC